MTRSKTMTKAKAEVDMSPEAVAGRLEVVRALYKLGVSLVQAGRDAGLAPPPRAK